MKPNPGNFTSDDFYDLEWSILTEALKKEDGLLRALLSNNLNMIIAALRIAAEVTWKEEGK